MILGFSIIFALAVRKRKEKGEAVSKILFSLNDIVLNIVNIIMLITYRIISYVILLSINYIVFNNNVFFRGIYKSLILNIVYGILLYLIIEIIAKRFNKKRVE